MRTQHHNLCNLYAEIWELMMTYLVIEPIIVTHKKQTHVLAPGQTFTTQDEDTIKTYVEEKKIKVVENSPVEDDGNILAAVTAGRQKTMQMVMDAIMTTAVEEITKEKRWSYSAETRKIEAEIEDLQRDIMNNSGKIIDFADAVKRWKRAGTK